MWRMYVSLAVTKLSRWKRAAYVLKVGKHYDLISDFQQIQVGKSILTDWEGRQVLNTPPLHMNGPTP